MPPQGIGDNMKQKFNITGMTCSACANHVEKAVNKLSGIQKANVNLMQKVLLVEYDKTIVSIDAIKQAVEKAGYGIFQQELDKKTTIKDTLQKDTISIKKRLWISTILLILVMYIAMGHMMGMPLPSFLSGLHNSINFAMSQFLLTMIIIYLNQSYFINGFRSLFHLTPTMDTLIAIGSSAAVVYGIYAILQMGYGLAYQDFALVEMYHMDLYFESAATIVTLITIGKYLELHAKGKTNNSIEKLMNLAPKSAIIEIDGKEQEIPLEHVQEGDILIVRSGSSIPVDGLIVQGNTTIDESAITGESMPVEKGVNAKVTGGCISVSGFFKMQATRVGKDTTLAQIIQLVEDANATKAPIAKLADKVSGVFVPIVITIAFIATITWLLLGYSTSYSLSIGIAVLIISCPCALGLATPTAIMVGTGKGAENGILFKTAQSLEIMQAVDVIVLDKTGTITQGKPTVSDLYTKNNDTTSLLQIALDIEYPSEHPLALAIVNEATKQGLTPIKMDEFIQVSGQGIIAKREQITYLAGNKKMMEEHQIDVQEYEQLINTLSNAGKTPLFFTKTNKIIGIIALQDKIKVNSKAAVQQLLKMNKEVILLSGDNNKTTTAIGKQLGLTSIISDVLPQDKEQYIRSIKDGGKTVAMVGDGINDAPSLARVDIGIAIGAGSDIAIESGDVVLMHSDLLDIITTIKLSQATLRNIKENLFWAFIYNIIGIPIAAGIFYPTFGFKLNPMFASAAMSLSSLFVVFNALRLRFFKVSHPRKQSKPTPTKGGSEMKKEMIIEGMTCGHCQKRVEEALNKIDGVKAVVDLDNKTAVLQMKHPIEDTILLTTIESIGYEVISIKEDVE